MQKDVFTNRMDIALKTGVGIRYDDVNDVELSHTLNRNAILEQLAYGNVDETNIYSFLQSEFKIGKWLINPALRLDYFQFGYSNKLENPFITQQTTQLRLNPKFNIFYTPNSQWQFFWKSGTGFHSNDSRVVVTNPNLPTLPVAYGTDLGMVWKPSKGLIFNMALWYLFLDQEFVYVGDEGIVEPSGQTHRRGVDFGIQYQLRDWLIFYTDVNYSLARSIEEPQGENYIPLAPSLTSTGGFTINNASGFSGSFKYRYLSDRPANEDYSITAKGYFIIDTNVNYSWEKITLGVVVENLFNAKWNEAQFATTSRLRDETTPVEEIHFTPGSPFFLKGKMTYNF